jgi:uncharacterized membrane protein YtjA (UPF0391 family)
MRTQSGGEAYSNAIEEDTAMLSWTLTFLVIALIAGLLGFVGLEGMAMMIAKTLFFIFLILFIVSLVFGRRPPIV